MALNPYGQNVPVGPGGMGGAIGLTDPAANGPSQSETDASNQQTSAYLKTLTQHINSGAKPSVGDLQFLDQLGLQYQNGKVAAKSWMSVNWPVVAGVAAVLGVGAFAGLAGAASSAAAAGNPAAATLASAASGAGAATDVGAGAAAGTAAADASATAAAGSGLAGAADVAGAGPGLTGGVVGPVARHP